MEEILKSITDLPIAIVCLIFAIILLRAKSDKKGWGIFFALTFVSAALGAVVHAIEPYTGLYKVLWAIEYLFIYESIRWFGILLVAYAKREDYHNIRNMMIVEIWCFLFSVILMLYGNSLDIYFVVVFGLIVLLWLVIEMYKNERFNIKLIIICFCALMAGTFQALKNTMTYGVVIGHVFIVAAVVVLYLFITDSEEE